MINDLVSLSELSVFSISLVIPFRVQYVQ